MISNIATGETGMLLAEHLLQQGAGVTLLLGPQALGKVSKKIRVIRFQFFDALRKKVIQELGSRKYDWIIHAAAVSDFAPQGRIKGKLSSGKKLVLALRPLPKILHDIRERAKKAKVVMFKLECGVSAKTLVLRARRAQLKAGADFVVANSLDPYRAFIVDADGHVVSVRNKKDLVHKLTHIILNC